MGRNITKWGIVSQWCRRCSPESYLEVSTAGCELMELPDGSLCLCVWSMLCVGVRVRVRQAMDVVAAAAVVVVALRGGSVGW